jgi:hypothetical protein
VGHASRSSGLLHVEASRAGIFQSDLKTGGCAMTDCTCDIIMKITSE